MQQLSLHCPAMPLASFQKLHRINKPFRSWCIYTVFFFTQFIAVEFNCNHKYIQLKLFNMKFTELIPALTYAILHLITVLLQVILNTTLKEIKLGF